MSVWTFCQFENNAAKQDITLASDLWPTNSIVPRTSDHIYQAIYPGLGTYSLGNSVASYLVTLHIGWDLPGKIQTSKGG